MFDKGKKMKEMKPNNISEFMTEIEQQANEIESYAGAL